jgi:NarL family two-component system response regulator LiaR
VTRDARPITVLIADDHEVVRRGVRAFFASQPDLEVVAEAASGRDAVQAARALGPDVAVLDLRMPGMDGVEAMRHIQEASPTTRIVVLTSYWTDEELFPALRGGALSYLLKDVSAHELADAVRRAARGEPTMSPRIVRRLMQDVVGTQQGPAPEPLTPRETEVLRLLAEGLSNHEIAVRLDIAGATVKGHVGHLLAKLNLSDRTQAAVHAWRAGLVTRADDEPL